MKKILTLLLILTSTLNAMASEADSTKHWGLSVTGSPSSIISLDKYEKKWVQKGTNGSVAAELRYSALPSDSDEFAKDFGYPTLAIGLRYTMNGAVRMHRFPDPDWGMAEEVDYDSRLGNTLSLYGTFYRALHRSRHWETSYSLSAGFGYNRKRYNRENNIDNELIGTPFLIYFAARIHQTYRFARNWGVKAGLEFVHHSNGALYRPNKGSNTLGPSLGVVYYPYYEETVEKRNAFQPAAFRKYWYMNVAAGVGGKTLLEDWLLTQFGTPPTDPNYRTEHFKFYMACSIQADLMYRYARRWASGIGIDWFYGTYSNRIKEIDIAKGADMKHSPWSLGISGKHEVFYHNLSLAMAFGFYLHRQMGDNARHNETPYYERIGIHYSFPALKGLKIGINVKAHKTKADLTELVVTYPIRL